MIEANRASGAGQDEGERRAACGVAELTDEADLDALHR